MKIQVKLQDFGNLDNQGHREVEKRYLLIQIKAKRYFLAFRGISLPGSQLLFIDEVNIYEVIPRSRRKKREKALSLLKQWNRDFFRKEPPDFTFSNSSEPTTPTFHIQCDNWQNVTISSSLSFSVYSGRLALEIARLQ